MPKKNENMSEDNLLKPGEEEGEGYKGTPDLYPDKEIDFEEEFNSMSKDDMDDEGKSVSVEIEGLREGGMCRGGGKAIRGKGFKGVF
jgi:hypothetical protein